jgi:PAS domain S-box-containing protein
MTAGAPPPGLPLPPRLVLITALVPAAVGLAAVVGWLTHTPTLTSVVPGLSSMKMNTALGFILGGSSLYLSLRPERWAAQLSLLCALVMGTIALLTLVEYALGSSFGIDQLLIRDGTAGAQFPGRPGVNTAAALLLLAMALPPRQMLHQPPWLTEAAVIAALLIGLVALLGYLYHVASFTGLASATQMAVHTALGVVLLAVGVLARDRDGPAVRIALGPGSGGRIVRQLLPIAVVLLTVFGWLRLLGQRAGLYDTEFGVAIVVLGSILMVAALTFWSAVQVNRDAAGRLGAEGQLRAVVESSPSGMVMIDRAGTIVLVNREIERQFGYSRESLLGQPIERLVPSRLREDHPRVRTEFFAHPQTRVMGAGRDLYGQRKDGTEIPVEIGLNPISTDRGQFVLASVVDITERKRAEARFRAAVESSPNGMVMIERSGKILLVNREVERLFGYSREELLGQPIEILVPSRLGASHPGLRTDFFAHPQTRAMGAGRDLHGVRKDGVEIPVEIGLNPIETDEGVFVLASVVDITQRKRAEAELKRSNEELERFAYVASHDLQEPLRMVGSYVQLLAKRYKGKLDQDADEFIGFALDGAIRMQRLIQDLLAFSRVSTKGVVPVPTEADAVLGAALASLKLTVEETGASVTYDRLPPVLADPGQLEHVFLNLISNALKFRGAAAPAIHIGASREGSEWRLTVRDNGIGIDPQYFDRIFVIFQRLNARTDYPGTGIGLAIVKKIVERHGGRIWVDSVPGSGTTFSFTLPAVSEA